MKKELFIHKLKHRGIRIIDTSDQFYDGSILDDFRSLKSFFQYIDFGCRINKKGGCKDTPESKMCCCYGCLDSAGYFRIILDKNITYYSRKFSVNSGFWRKGKGCILPHKMRSTTCLTHHCNHPSYTHPYFHKDDKYKHFERGMDVIKQKLDNMRRSI